MALLDKFTQFIQSPGATGLAAGLLQGSGPSMTQPSSFGSAFGMGLNNMQKSQEEALKRNLAERYFGLDQSKFGLAQKEFGLKEGEMELKRRQAALKQQAIQGLLGGGQQQQPYAPPPMNGQPEGVATGMIQDPGAYLTEPSPPKPANATWTVQDPRVNGGKLTAIPAIENGREMPEEEAIQKHANKGLEGAALLPLNEAPPNLGLIGKQQPNFADKYTPEQKALAGLAFANDDIKGVIDVLKPKDNEIIQTAKYIYPDDLDRQRAFIEEAKLPSRSAAQKEREIGAEKRDNTVIEKAQEEQVGGRKVRKVATDSYALAKKLRAKGFDPYKNRFTAQLTRREIGNLLGNKASEQDIKDYDLLNKGVIEMQVAGMAGISAKGINQYIEKRLAQASGSPEEVQMLTTQELMLKKAHEGIEKEFRAPFLEAYKDKYGSLKGAEEAYNTWMDTGPGAKMGAKNIDFVSERDIFRDMKNWVNDPNSSEYIGQRLKFIEKKDPEFATDEELRYLAEFGQ